MNETNRLIKQAFDKANISYSEFEKRSGIPKSSLQRYVTGETEKISTEKIMKIANALNIDLFSLFDFDTSTNTKEGEKMNAAEKKELISALKLIRAECKKHTGEVPCYECPLASESRGCCLNDDPRKWILADEKPDIWRAFKD